MKSLINIPAQARRLLLKWLRALSITGTNGAILQDEEETTVQKPIKHRCAPELIFSPLAPPAGGEPAQILRCA